MKLQMVKTRDILPGDRIENYKGCPEHQWVTVKSVEMPTEPDCVLATITTSYRQEKFWSGIDAVHNILRPGKL